MLFGMRTASAQTGGPASNLERTKIVAAYKLLEGIIVLEAAWLGPNALGGFLADMGATVVKIESPEKGDPLRFAGAQAVGDENGFGFLHLRWNRGKKSVALDLKTAKGVALFKRMAKRADVVIEGMRGGTLARLGVGYEALRVENPKLVFCSLSGLGLSGPYAERGSNAPSYDLFAGLATPAPGATVSKHQGPQGVPIGMYSMGRDAAIGVLAALVNAQRTGVGAEIEVAACDSAAHWLPEALEPILNKDVAFDRPNWLDNGGRMVKWSRLDTYRTKDGRLIYLQLYYDKFWNNFLRATNRADLNQLYDRFSVTEVDDEMAKAMTDLLLTRTFEEWVAVFDANGVPYMVVNDFADLAHDPHFVARDNIYTVPDPKGRPLRLTSTPIKVTGQSFAPALAPALGEHTTSTLRDVFELSQNEIDQLRAAGILG